MQALAKTLQQIRQQLGRLTPTARLLVGSLMVILVMTLFLVAQYTGRSQLEPLALKANLSSEARAQALSYIQARGITHREQGDEILVPAEQRYAVIAELTEGDVISPDQINFDSLIQQDSPFLSKTQNERRWLVATMNVLSQTISRLNGIQRAIVVIDEPKNPGGIGRAHIPASASVTVWTRGEPLDQSRVDAIAAMVAGSHASLKAEHVVVVDSNAGRLMRSRTDDRIHASANLELQQSREQLAQEKIASALRYIPGVNVAVHATVDTRSVQEKRRSFEEPRLGVTGESSRTLSSSNSRGGAESAMRPNTGANVTAGDSRGSTMTDEQMESSMIPAFGGSDSTIMDPRGYALQINATIGVPRSYFVRLLQEEQGDQTAQPDPDELAAVIAEETERIRAQIEPLIDTRAIDGALAGTVMVSVIPDFALAAIGGAVPGSGGAVDEGTAAGFALSDGLIRYGGLGSLVLVSLAMMFMLVRRAGVRDEVPSAAELRGAPPPLDAVDADIVGEATESMSTMEGLEINESDMRRQQMLNQINDMAKSHPYEAASLMRRWIKAEA